MVDVAKKNSECHISNDCYRRQTGEVAALFWAIVNFGGEYKLSGCYMPCVYFQLVLSYWYLLVVSIQLLRG